MYTFAYTYAGSRLKSPVFIGWFESSTALVAVFLCLEKTISARKNNKNKELQKEIGHPKKISPARKGAQIRCISLPVR